jgi:hypothetical protein
VPVGTRRVAVRLADWPAVFLWSGSAESRLAAPGVCAAESTAYSAYRCCVVQVRVAYAGRVDCLRYVELLPSQVGLLP